MKNISQIILVACTYFLVSMQQFVMASILDNIARAFDVSVAIAGQVNAAYAVAFAVGTPLILIALARMDKRKLYLLALISLFFGTLLTAASRGFFMLLLIRVFIGMVSGVAIVAGTDIITSLVPSEERGKALFNLALGASVALIFGMPASRFFTNLFSWQVVFTALAVLLVLLIAAAFRLLSPTEGEPAAPLRKQLSYLRNGKVLAVILTCVVNFISYSMIFTYIAPYLGGISDHLGAATSLVLMGLGISCFFGSKAGGILVGRIGPMETLVLGTLSQALFLVLLYLSSPSELLTVLFLLGWIFAGWMTGQTFSLNLILAAPEASGIMLSIGSSANQLGFALGAALGGFVISFLSIPSLAWTAGGISGASFIMGTGIFLWERKRNVLKAGAS